ncbi:MAG: phosphoglucosamine mutase [Actinomycetota bacterium]|nr:phosphoglucosamine mutase [Actinomycetota bacterium]
MKKYFGTDGIRGKANLDLTVEVATRLGRAAIRALGSKDHTVVVGRDTRISGQMLESALLAGLLSEGAYVYLAGIIPTPAVAFLTEDIPSEAGAVISASHNPFEDNGIKFFGAGGVKLPDETEKSIEAEFENLAPKKKEASVGNAIQLKDAEARYVEHLIASVGPDLSGLKVALDCANGAAFRVAPRVFKELGAEIMVICAEPDGRNINLGCGSTHPERISTLVKDWGADVGFAFDGDGDRCICVDETGTVRDGDFIMAIVARYMKERELLEPPLVVSTIMSNMGFYEALKELGIESLQVKVGDRYVLEGILASGSIIGGEQSGHIIFLEHASTGDGILTALVVSAIMVDTNQSLSSLAGVMRKYPQVLKNVKLKRGKRLTPDMKVWDLIKECERELGERGRVLLRSSGTEPVERVMVEALSMRKADEIANRIAEALEQELNF